MEKIRCLIADIPQLVLADIVYRIAESRSDIEVVGRVENKEGLPRLIRERSVDVVILGMETDTFQMECNEIFDAMPELIIVGLIEDGRRAAIFVDNVGSKELMDLVHMTFDHKRNRS